MGGILSQSIHLGLSIVQIQLGETAKVTPKGPDPTSAIGRRGAPHSSAGGRLKGQKGWGTSQGCPPAGQGSQALTFPPPLTQTPGSFPSYLKQISFSGK